MPARAYMRYRQGEPIESTVLFAPMSPEHPSHAEMCAECGFPLANGDYLRLRAHLRILEMDVEDSYKYKAGKWINAPADILHATCARTWPTVESQRTITVVRDE